MRRGVPGTRGGRGGAAGGRGGSASAASSAATNSNSSTNNSTNATNNFNNSPAVQELRQQLLQSIPTEARKKVVNLSNATNTEKYEGQVDSNSKRHGKGMLKWGNGNCYFGDWSEGAMSGTGTFLYGLEEDAYTGEFRDDKKHGRGKYTFANGNCYEGHFELDKRHGQGCYKWTCGDSYDGEWKDGRMHGFGVTVYANGNRYEGHFIEDRREGEGKLECTDGLSYEGMWLKNMRHGVGTLRFPSKDYYHGEWANDKKHGKGKDVFVNGNQFEGMYVENEKCGHGIMEYANGDRYEGDWKSDKMHGKGVYKFANGFLYDGDWAADTRHGHGTYKFPNGHVYVGQWKTDKRHGKGSLTLAPTTTKTPNNSTNTADNSSSKKEEHSDRYVGSWSEGKMSGDFEVFRFPVVRKNGGSSKQDENKKKNSHSPANSAASAAPEDREELRAEEEKFQLPPPQQQQLFSPNVSSNQEPTETALFDKVLIRLERGHVPNRDIGSLSDPCVTVKLANAPQWPEKFFGYCVPAKDKSDLDSLLEFTFSEKSNTLDPVWFEECMLMFYRPPPQQQQSVQKSDDDASSNPGPFPSSTPFVPPAASANTKLVLSCVDKDSVAMSDDILLSDFEVNIWEIRKKQEELEEKKKKTTTKRNNETGTTLLRTTSSMTDGAHHDHWVRVEAPCNGPGSDPEKHKIIFSIRVETAEERLVSREAFFGAELEEKVLELKKGNLSGGGRAVVSWKTRPENDKVFFWMPGLNASFHHVHVLHTLLREGWDVYTLDCRRMGRAKKFYREYDPSWDPLNAHTTADLREYCEEIDAMVELAEENKKKKDGGSGGGETYQYRVLYGNSTGALTCVTYLKSGQHASKIDGLALNGPFFDWHLAAYAEVLMKSSFLTSVYAKLAVGHGGTNVQDGVGISAYSLKTWAQYYYDVSEESLGLRSVPCLHTTTEWAKAVTRAQKALKADGERKPFTIPIFVIASASDAWVSSDEVLATSDFLGPNRTEVQVPNAEHDVFMSTTKSKVDECKRHMIAWLNSYFPS